MPKPVQLTAKWQLDAALLSRPVDLTPLVTMSQVNPEEFLKDDTVPRMVTVLLNEANESKSDRDTKLDVLTVLANVALSDQDEAKELVRTALHQVSEWFDTYLGTENDPESEPELHKVMTLLLARAWEYRLKTEDVLELTGGNRLLALETLVSLLEDGETYSTELKQRKKPGQGQLACWEHELVCHRYEKPLILQMCRLIRGFTHPMTYFNSSTEEVELHSVEQFSAEIDRLLDTTLRSRLIEKLSVALHDCIFQTDEGEPERLMSEHDHLAIVSVNAFLQNLYFYATHRNDEYRQHLLSDTLLIPRLVLPYLEQCVVHAIMLEKRGNSTSNTIVADASDEINGLPLDAPAVVKGIAASLRTLVIATFRAPTTRFVMDLLRRFNPTLAILKAAALISKNGYLFSLLCVLNVNMGALAAQDCADEVAESSMESQEDTVCIHTLLHHLGEVYSQMDQNTRVEVARRVMFSTALPITRDTPSYMAIMSVLHGGAAGQLEYVKGMRSARSDDDDEDVPQTDMRAAAKKEARDRFEQLRSAKNRDGHRERESQFRHLADLPDLHQPKHEQAKFVMELELPTEVNRKRPMLAENKGAEARTTQPEQIDDGIPIEFKCSINGHVMKEPVRSPYGQVFERATIELWLKTRGSICPITNQTLALADLQPADELRAQIMRWHIQKTAFAGAGSPSRGDVDDLYDF